MSRIDSVRPRIEEGLQTCAYDDHMGFRFQVDEMQRGRTIILADVGEAYHNPEGTVHGGILAGLADSAMGSCMFTLLDDDEHTTNVDLNIKFLRPTVEGRLRAESHVVKEGRTTCLIATEITNEHGKLVARAEATFLRIAG